MPIAIAAALKPTTPPPITITLAAGTPGTPPSSTPRPPRGRSRKKAPAWVAILPATSLIGASSGSRPWASVTVSYAMQVAPDATSARVSSGSGARCR